MFEFDFLAVVDGGSRGNGAANEGYGSYCQLQRNCGIECRSSGTVENGFLGLVLHT